MPDDFRKLGILYGGLAVQAHEAGNLAKAIHLHEVSALYFQTHLKYEKRDFVKVVMALKLKECSSRAEEIRAVLNAGAGPAADGKLNDGGEGAIGEDQEQSKPRAVLNSAIIRKKPDLKWNDVAGLENARQALLQEGKGQPRRAFLLYGPRGTGKSYLANAVATKTNSTLFSVRSKDLVSKCIGESEKVVSNLFQVARESAPSIIFVDEIDYLCGHGEGSESEALRRIKT